MTLGEFAKGAAKVIGVGCVGMTVMRDPDMGVTMARDMWLAGNDEYATMLMRFAETGFEYQKRDPLAGV
jgi:hypothetical protein